VAADYKMEEIKEVEFDSLRKCLQVRWKSEVRNGTSLEEMGVPSTVIRNLGNRTLR